MKLETKLMSSLIKVFPDEVKGEPIKSATVLANEAFSFQIAFRLEQKIDEAIPLYLKVETDLPHEVLSEYLVGYVPVTRGDYQKSDEYFERKTPGLYPDMLLQKNPFAVIKNDGQPWLSRWEEQDETNLLSAVRDSYQTLWFTVNEDEKELKPGTYSVKVSFFNSYEDELIGEETVSLTVLDAKLPEQTLYYTSWFHHDCLADIYGVEIFSKRYFEIMRSFVTVAAKHGMNMILLPAFTPALDTTPGRERRTAQLVKVNRENGVFTFDFSLLKRYIEICRECGIVNFEHCHFFTQWGAKHAPKVMAIDNGEYKRIFGWDTDATSEEYTSFLQSYLRALKPFLKEMDLENHIMFHISDEPDAKHLSYYENARKIIGEEVKDYMCGDALSHYEFYENGCTKMPIVMVTSPDMAKFEKNCNNYWVYYTGGQLTEGSSNRIISTTSARNRVIGLQMYAGDAKGFLHWGYNYYYGVLSHGLFNPAMNPCGYNQLAGTSYLVYPSMTGEAIPSLRMKVFGEGLGDYRALKLLESKIGREKVLSFMEKTIGKVNYKFCPTNSQLFEFRQKLNAEILKYTDPHFS